MCFVALFILIRTDGLSRSDSRHSHEKKKTLLCGHGSLKHPSFLNGIQAQTDRVFVRFRPSLSQIRIESCLTNLQVRNIRRIPELSLYSLQVPEGLTAEEMVSVLQMDPDVEFSEPDYRTFICDYPNDTFFPFQYGLLNTGQPIGPNLEISGSPGADIKAVEAWKEVKGKASVVVAVLDTGLDFDHPDLQNNLVPFGPDFVNGDLEPIDDQGHGTMISGIIGADTNNGRGIAGAAWNCKILPIKSIDHNGEGYSSWILQGIIYAADRHVDVINLSVGAEGPSDALRLALKYAYDRDIVIVSSTGNRRGKVSYPAAYNDYCLAVAATDYYDHWASFSNRGNEVDVAAPGCDIFCCEPVWLNGEGALPYGYITGTSVATAYVSALAALIRGLKPWLTASEVMDVIRFTADDINSDMYPGRDIYIGYGRINMKKALSPILIQ